MNIIRAPLKPYNEITQTSKTKFSFLDEKEDHFVELFSPVKCRDFLETVSFLSIQENMKQFMVLKRPQN